MLRMYASLLWLSGLFKQSIPRNWNFPQITLLERLEHKQLWVNDEDYTLTRITKAGGSGVCSLGFMLRLCLKADNTSGVTCASSSRSN